MNGNDILWYDLSSLATHDGVASGIQRVAAGLAVGLREASGARAIRFCSFDKKRGFVAVSDDETSRILERVALGLPRPDKPRRRLVDRIRRRRRTPLAAPFAPGDVLFNPGFATYKREQQPEVAALLARLRVSYVGSVYDLVPVLFPEWWRPDQQSRYRDWLVWTGRSAALVLACSNSTRGDALRFFADEKIAAAPVETIRLGDELPHRLRAASADAARGAAQPPYVLYVSTLEVRKNHRLLFQVWRRLLAAHGRERIPDLLLAGRRGWLIDDFVTELEQCRFLDGKILWREHVEDDELARLYAGCLFSVYPSLYEGWGLPVAESLAFGKTAVVSSASSLPEVGCAFVDYHDPHDVAGATARIERMVFDRAHRESLERAIRERFRARTWAESAVELLSHVEPLFARVSGPAGTATAASRAVVR